MELFFTRAHETTHGFVLVRTFGLSYRTRWFGNRGGRGRWPQAARGCPGVYVTQLILTIMILLTNLAATTSAVVARLDRLEGAHFDARGPADLGAIGSTTIATPESIIKVCSSAQVSSSTGSSSAGDMPTAECEQAPLPAPAHPSPQTVADYIDTPPPAARPFNC